MRVRVRAYVAISVRRPERKYAQGKLQLQWALSRKMRCLVRHLHPIARHLDTDSFRMM